MDDPLWTPTEEMARQLMSIARLKAKPWFKMMAIHRIKMQPFFGDISPKSQSDKLKIRRLHANTP